MEYRIVRIPKGSNRFREIYIPSAEAKVELRKLLPFLEETLHRLDQHHVSYSFRRGKNCALNALQHAGYRYTLSFDIEDFFASIRRWHLDGIVPSRIIDQCFVDGAPRQGLPTSPLISELAFCDVDDKIIRYLRSLNVHAIYTRYADDLVFSFDERRDVAKITTIVRHVISDAGFCLNARKTNLQDAKNGRIVVNGIAVDKTGIYATRRMTKRLRAATHQRNATSEAGLLEWCKCKLPGLTK